MSGLKNLFSKPKMPDPEPPATMPDDQDEITKRARRKQMTTTRAESSSAQTRLAPVPGTIGKEFTRSTLGAR
ncbi:hypothetical protein CYG48_04995 [Neorhizobium sp. SOG26]|uniref:hypothetical protein n=1 Tax=Neorhizobium sp. SOG26 TaxID=2060726 RepID=UPI000E5815F2|nr:hypothetical protein [Neorhizobium sp. SOG26]AXV15113.1 hypothetical protein CYG48_04995 [Neorhizobium sp. SOG26]